MFARIAILIIAVRCVSAAGAIPPGYDQTKIDRHRQIYNESCVASSVEMVLKLVNMPPSQRSLM